MKRTKSYTTGVRHPTWSPGEYNLWPRRVVDRQKVAVAAVPKTFQSEGIIFFSYFITYSHQYWFGWSRNAGDTRGNLGLKVTTTCWVELLIWHCLCSAVTAESSVSSLDDCRLITERPQTQADTSCVSAYTGCCRLQSPTVAAYCYYMKYICNKCRT